ncbi:MAG: hypothetical protein ACPLYF_01975 [Fervidobacterium sp.]
MQIMWDKIILAVISLTVVISLVGLFYIIVKKPNDEIKIKTRTLLITIIAIGLLLIRSYLEKI